MLDVSQGEVLCIPLPLYSYQEQSEDVVSFYPLETYRRSVMIQFLLVSKLSFGLILVLITTMMTERERKADKEGRSRSELRRPGGQKGQVGEGVGQGVVQIPFNSGAGTGALKAKPKGPAMKGANSE